MSVHIQAAGGVLTAFDAYMERQDEDEMDRRKNTMPLGKS